MSVDRPVSIPLQLMVVEDDPMRRLGLVTGLGQFADLRVAAEAETGTIALELLTQRQGAIDLVLLNGQSRDALKLCRQLKDRRSSVPIVLLGAPIEAVLREAFQMGIEGYCPQGSSVAELVRVIRRVAAGERCWNRIRSFPQSPLVTFRQTIRSTGLRQIEAILAQIEAELQAPGLSIVDQALLAGQRRELRAARWFVRRLLPTAAEPLSETVVVTTQADNPPPDSFEGSGAIVPSTASPTPRDLQAQIFDRVAAKLHSDLENLTTSPLEIDLFKVEKKRELFYSVLRQIEASLDELRFSQLQASQLVEKRSTILRDLWQSVMTEFLGRYYTLRVDDRDVEIVAILLQDVDKIQTEILDCIPLVLDLYNTLLFETWLAIDNTSYPASSPEAIDRTIALLENLTIHLANAVVQPLLNRFSDVETVKQVFYDRRLLSTRDIERFRNDLSWRYRIDRAFAEPKAMFESRHKLWVLSDFGIRQIFIYNPRGQELEKLQGIGLAVTLALETRDALTPRLQSAIRFLGSGVVYVLTDVIGRGIGLIGRGILKGIGNAWQENKRREF
ncbi:MAG: DUF3685 domain-containing protein [Leptolyngbyaceae cyanobacterium CSU_1_3]|nr:DUF3685 domain-containing protein [Leptolyngbyaceae cyanobacterium CSU_1_3]